MAILIAGAAGFIGCNLARCLLPRGERIFGIDNLCRGHLSNLGTLLEHPRFSFVKADMHDIDAFREAFAGLQAQEPISAVWHMAANSDIPAGVEDPAVDLRDTFMTTYNTLLLMKQFAVPNLAFASSSAVYGDFGERPLTEDLGPLLPISNYGAMKLASEAAISAAAESHLRRAHIFRFPNVVGVPATHGVILDFVRRLRAEPSYLQVLGDGTQQKAYLHVSDLVDAMLMLEAHAKDRINLFNIGPVDQGVTVRWIAEQTVAAASPGAELRFGTGNRGWVGDVPRFSYSVARLQALGWKPSLESVGAVQRAIAEIVRQEAAAGG